MILPHDHPFSAAAVFIVPTAIILTVKLSSYAVLFKVFLSEAESWKMSFRRCFIGGIADGLYLIAVALFFWMDVLPTTKGHVGLPVEYIALPLGTLFPRLLSWALFARTLKAYFSPGSLTLISIYGLCVSYVGDFLAFSIWWFTWNALTT